MKLILLIGASGVGKDSLADYITREHYYIKKVKQYTTRPKRDNELNLSDDELPYHFITKEEFDLLENNNQFLETRMYETEFGTWYYGTCIDGEYDTYDKLILPCSLEQYNKIKFYISVNNVNDISLYPIYLRCSLHKRIERSLQRINQHDDKQVAEILRRLYQDEKDFSKSKLVESGISELNTINTTNIDIYGTYEWFMLLFGLKLDLCTISELNNLTKGDKL